MNIFHELAEKAFAEEFLSLTSRCVHDYLVYASNEHYFWFHYFQLSDRGEFYTRLNSEEQALALLFIGEMYESSGHG